MREYDFNNKAILIISVQNTFWEKQTCRECIV